MGWQMGISESPAGIVVIVIAQTKIAQMGDYSSAAVS